MPILVDSNVILDVVSQDPSWEVWSSRALEENAGETFWVNSMIYAELCCNVDSSKDVDDLLSTLKLELFEIPREALFLASKAHQTYRRRGGTRTTGLPDFFIGAHAQVLGIPLLTRDKGRYQSYFPEVTLICP